MAKQAKKPNGGGQAAKKKKTPIWYAVTILAVMCTGIVGAGVFIYWEELFPESHRKMTKAVGEAASSAAASAKSRFSDLMSKASQFNFDARGFPLCREAESQSKTPKGWQYRDLTSVLGLPPFPSRDDVLARCQAYANAIHQMQNLSGPKAAYEVICAEHKTHFEIDSRRNFGIWPTAEGVRQNFAPTLATEIPVRIGEIRLIQSWQVYGLGDGCYVVGSDKLSMFQRSGSVEKDAE